MLGGSTIYDADANSLKTLATAWAASLPYETRIQQIRDEAFQAHLESEETLFDDAISDSLSGGSGQDWFIQTGYVATYRPSDVQWHEHGHEEEGDHHHAQIIIDSLPALEGFALLDSIDKVTDGQSNEQFYSLISHADSTTLQREHISLFQLVRYDQVTNYAIKSGVWSDPSIWKNGVLPISGARVLIPSGVDVVVDGILPARISTIRVDGTLAFDTTRNTELKVDTLIVASGGAFEMGTADRPIAAGVKARLLITNSGPIDRAWDPFGISRGLISHGSVSIYGAAVSSYSALTVQPVAISLTLTLASVPVGWKPGDSIVIAATTADPTQNETRTISAIIGNTVVLDRPLSYNHVSPAADLQVHVANLTRNAVIESESTEIDRRGHVMLMHSRDVDIAYAGFYKLGRTDKSRPIDDPVVTSSWTLQAGTGTNPRGRYAVHFHRNGVTNDGEPATIMGSAVVDSPGWGFVNHSSHVDMTNNVAYDVHGAGFATEVGDEIGGFYNNIAIGSTGVNENMAARSQINIQDFGFEGDGFWFQGAGISVVGNIAAGNQANGFVFYTLGLYEGMKQAQFRASNLVDPSIAGGAATIPVEMVPVREFSNNIGYASQIGITVRYQLQNASGGQISLFESSAFWNNTLGVDLPYTHNTILRNVRVIHGPSARPFAGIRANWSTKNITYENLTVSGYNRGIELPRHGYAVVSGGTYINNYVDIALPTAIIDGRSALITGTAADLKVQAVFDTYPVSGFSATTFFANDVVLLNFGALVNQRLYNVMQLAGEIPFPVARFDLPAQYVGLTNQQLWNQFGVALGGSIAPSNLISVPNIIGLVTPKV
jgi:hypothetical protein